MSGENKQWWERRVLRSVEQLKLWANNPRLDASGNLGTVREFVEELIGDPIDKQDFITLIKDIGTRGFIPLDPIVVWQDKETKQFLVAEGNRRVMALKLLLSPDRAPMTIRKVVVAASRKIDRDTIEKIRVCVAPSFDDARWYILQRHSSAASSHVRWQRLQQQRFIIDTYDAVDQNIEKTIEITGFNRAAIIDALRYVKIRDMATHPEVMALLSPEDQSKVTSHKISMTVLERWFGNSQVREAWHIEFDENGATFNAEPKSFHFAYAAFLKGMFNKVAELGYTINTRTIDSNFQQIFDYLPEVKSINEADSENISTDESTSNPAPDISGQPIDSPAVTQTEPVETASPVLQKPMKGDPKRRHFTDDYHEITCGNYKINALFDELKGLPIYRYPNVAAASIRIFLDLAVDEYIVSNDFKGEVARRERKGYHEVTLIQKLSILRGEFIDDREANKVIDQLLHQSNDHSLNTLNEYIHGDKVHKIEPQFLNRFWDMLSPLFAVLINMRAI